jgi:tetratricopeptide (TPR) repeat protein
MTELGEALQRLALELRPRPWLSWPGSVRGRRRLVGAGIVGGILLVAVVAAVRSPSAAISSANNASRAVEPVAAAATPLEQALQAMDRDDHGSALSILEDLNLPQDPHILALQGTCCAHLRRWKDAIAFYEQALLPDYERARGPDFDLVPLWNNLGYCYAMARQDEKAREILLLATQANPKAAMPWANLAFLDARSGISLQKVPSLDPLDRALSLGGANVAVLAAATRTYALVAMIASRYDQNREPDLKDACLRMARRAIEAGHSTRLIDELRAIYRPGESEFDALAKQYDTRPDAAPSARHSQLLPVR